MAIYITTDINNSDFNCDYSSPSQYKQFCQSQPSSLKIMSLNVRSFKKNFDNFLPLFENASSHPDVLIICETWFANLDQCEKIEGFSAYHVLRPGNGRGGGISVYIKDTLKSEQLIDFSLCDQSIEINSVKIEINSLSFYIVGIYRPFSDTIENFSNRLQDILHRLGSSNNDVILAGDFNIDLLNDNPTVNSFMYSMQQLHFAPKITKPTRFPTSNVHSPTLLDHFYINSHFHSVCGIIEIDITDHCPIFLNIPIPNISSEVHSNKVKVTFRDHSINNMERFESILSNFDWSTLENEDISLHTSSYLSKVDEIYCNCFPSRTKFFTKKRLSQPWLSNSLIQLTKQKSHSFKLYHQRHISLQEHKAFKNRVRIEIRAAKRKYYKFIFEKYKTNIRMTWKTIRNLINKSDCSKSIRRILVNNTEYTSDSDIVQIFNDYFSNIASNLDNDIPHSDIDPLSYVPLNPSSIFP